MRIGKRYKIILKVTLKSLQGVTHIKAIPEKPSRLTELYITCLWITQSTPYDQEIRWFVTHVLNFGTFAPTAKLEGKYWQRATACTYLAYPIIC